MGSTNLSNLSGVREYVYWSGLKEELASSREGALLEVPLCALPKSPFEFCITEIMMYDI